ncbi:MAG: 1-deoxy-D-xylulose-5-phosphate reductoisomerase [Pseudomonadota bacterium]
MSALEIVSEVEPERDVRRLSILGSTGSIGCSAIEVIRHQPERFDVVALVGNRNVALLAEQAVAVNARTAVTADASLYGELKSLLSGTTVSVAAGETAVLEAAREPADLTLAAIVGAAGLEPTLASAEEGATIALANKECLVCAGDVFKAALEASGSRLLPVDSEHSAVFQVFEDAQVDQVEKIILTASGGPFRTITRKEMMAVTPEQALNHPNWDMGPKITIDSATLMNKGLELIEAFHLFPVGCDQLDAVIHPQSIVHSMVAYKDGSVLAQMGVPDMKTPIAYALAWPDRMPAPVERLDLAAIGQLTFEPVDRDKFPSVGLCLACLERGGSAAAIMNAANEVAVAEFLAGKIPFLGITELSFSVLDEAESAGMVAPMSSLLDVSAADEYGRRTATDLARRLHS